MKCTFTETNFNKDLKGHTKEGRISIKFIVMYLITEGRVGSKELGVSWSFYLFIYLKNILS